ncbi:50S ribosome-binding GTPase [bacterium]|nr:50S ribosome-binding GTPase [bacterium]
MADRNQILEKIAALEEEIRSTPYHKGTEHHIGLLRARIAKLREELYQPKKGGGKAGWGIKKEGDASCVLVGPPSAGKSTLLNALTGANSKTGSYDFTTLRMIPGVMFYRGAKIQIFDLPGLIAGASQGKGDGKQIISAIRGADLVILVVDVTRLHLFSEMKEELSRAGVRLNQSPPKIKVKKLSRGGVRIINPYHNFPEETLIEIACEFGIKNGEIIFQEKIDSLEKVIDVLMGNRAYLPCLEVVTKIDLQPGFKGKGVVGVSALKDIGLEKLKEAIWEKVGLIRVYLKKDKKSRPDFSQPLILKKGVQAIEAAEAISSQLREETKRIFIWGPGAKFPGQEIPFSHPLRDGSILFFEKRVRD